MPFDRPLAKIRSFVRREGRMTESQQRALEQWLPQYRFPADTGVTVDLSAVFGNSRPVILEIGFGNGDLLATLAQSYPYLNFIGAEVHRPGVGHLLHLVHHQKLSNVRVFNDDVMNLLSSLPEASLQAVHLYYPDPWPKKKHNKRRLVTQEWLAQIQQRLKPGGLIHMATDWQDYAEQMLQVMDSSLDFTNAAGSGKYHPRPAWRPITRFELRGDRLGHGQWDLIHVHTPQSSD